MLKKYHYYENESIIQTICHLILRLLYCPNYITPTLTAASSLWKMEDKHWSNKTSVSMSVSMIVSMSVGVSTNYNTSQTEVMLP
jgi:hypothetical protein